MSLWGPSLFKPPQGLSEGESMTIMAGNIGAGAVAESTHLDL